MRIIRTLFVPLSCVLITCLALSAQSQLSPAVRDFVKVDAASVVLTHVRIIDGTGGPARENQTIVIAGGKIQFVGDATANVPADAKILDLTGKSVIPGLVGMHDHMFYPAGGAIFHEMAFSFPRLYLAAGVDFFSSRQQTPEAFPHQP